MKQMKDETIDALNKAFDVIAPEEWTKTHDGKTFTLDGHYSLAQLDAIVVTIKLHQALDN